MIGGEKKKGWKVGWVIPLFLLIFIGENTPGTNPQKYPEPLIWSVSDFQNLTEWSQFLKVRENKSIIGAGTATYILAEMKYPASFEELCASPYIPVRCSDLINPYTGKRMEDREGSPGDVYFHFSPRGSLIITEYALTKGNIGGFDDPQDFPLQLIQAMESRYSPPGRPSYRERTYGKLITGTFEEKSAWAVGYYLDSLFVKYMDAVSNFRSLPPPTIPEFLFTVESRLKSESWNLNWSVYPQLERLRNEFTGRYAKEVEAPSPGDYQYLTDTTGREKRILRVFGKNGEVVYEKSLVAAIGPAYRQRLQSNEDIIKDLP